MDLTVLLGPRGPLRLARMATSTSPIQATGGWRCSTRRAAFQFDFGRKGGQLDEPVGIAVGDGRVYVADTWNMRVADVRPAKASYGTGWPVAGWTALRWITSPTWPSMITGGRVYLTDPEGYRVLVYSTGRAAGSLWENWR
jgi:hypothetical protein